MHLCKYVQRLYDFSHTLIQRSNSYQLRLKLDKIIWLEKKSLLLGTQHFTSTEWHKRYTTLVIYSNNQLPHSLFLECGGFRNRLKLHSPSSQSSTQRTQSLQKLKRMVIGFNDKVFTVEIRVKSSDTKYYSIALLFDSRAFLLCWI